MRRKNLLLLILTLCVICLVGFVLLALQGHNRSHDLSFLIGVLGSTVSVLGAGYILIKLDMESNQKSSIN